MRSQLQPQFQKQIDQKSYFWGEESKEKTVKDLDRTEVILFHLLR